MSELTFPTGGFAVSRAEPQPAAGSTDTKLREVAVEFATVYLTQMLASMKLGNEPDSFGGGFGAEAFRSFLNEAYAERIAERSGSGIAEMVYRQLQRASTP